MDQNRAAAAAGSSSSKAQAQFPGQPSSSHYPPTSGTDYYYSSNNTTLLPSGTAVGAPEPSPPPSLLGQAAAVGGGQAGPSSFTSTWITPASTSELAAAGDDDNSFADTDFVYENGRRYHAPADGRVVYPLPNDESEQERDDMKHKLALWMMHEKLLYAPVEEALNRGGMVFDLGMFSSLCLSVLTSGPSGPLLSNHALNSFPPLSQSGQTGLCIFSFSFRPLANYPAAASRPSSWHYQPRRQGLGPWRAELNNVTHVAFFFFPILNFLGVPQNGNRGLTYCVTQKQVPEQGNGPWKVSATILVFCISLLCFYHQSTLLGCHVSEDFQWRAKVGHDVLKRGPRNTACYQTWLWLPRRC